MSNFKRVLNILTEGRGNPLERKHYKVKYDKLRGYYTIVGPFGPVKAGIETKELAIKICQDMNDEME